VLQYIDQMLLEYLVFMINLDRILRPRLQNPGSRVLSKRRQPISTATNFILLPWE
jgi:hypothetical protein